MKTEGGITTHFQDCLFPLPVLKAVWCTRPPFVS
jgi:hypothetical protein